MADRHQPDDAHARGALKILDRLHRTISDIQRYRRQRRSKKQQESAADRAGRSTARATWFIAALTAVTVGVGISQYIIFSRQLDEMRETRKGTDQSFETQIRIMLDQTKAMQGQLDQMVSAQRAWLMVDNLSVNGIDQFPAGIGIAAFSTYRVTNLGHSPATSVFIRPALFFESIDKFDTETVRRLCRPQPSDEELQISEYADTVLPGQSQTIDGIGQGATFSHGIDNIPIEMEARRKEGEDELRRLGVRVPPTQKQDNVIYVSPILAGCITYKTAGSDALHQTGFAFSARIDPLHQMRIELGRKGEVFSRPLNITPSPRGNFAN